MTTDPGPLRTTLGKWDSALRHGKGDLAPFWRRIWRLHWEGQHYCVKLPRRPGEVSHEAALLRCLHAAGYPVPRVYWSDEETGIFVMEWIDGPSLEALLHQSKSDEREQALATCVKGLAHLEQAAELVAQVVPSPELDPPNAHELATTVAALTHHLAPQVDMAPVQVICETFAEDIRAGPSWRLGIVDILPRDVILSTDRAIFLDFWPIGWRWSERRFCDYFARFQQDDADRSYQSGCFLEHFPESDARCLDAHYLWHDLSYLHVWQELRDSPTERKPPPDAVDSIIEAARRHLGWPGACAAANEIRALLEESFSGRCGA